MSKDIKSILKTIFGLKIIGLTILIATAFLYFGVHTRPSVCNTPQSYPENLSRVIGPCIDFPSPTFNMILLPFLYIIDQFDQIESISSPMLISLLILQLIYFFILAHIIKYSIVLILELNKKAKSKKKL